MQQELRIAFIVNNFPRVSETFILNQIIDLIDRGHHVDIYAKKQDKWIIHQKVLDYRLIDRTHFYPIPASTPERIKQAGKIMMYSKKNFLRLIQAFNVFKYGGAVLDLAHFFKYARFINVPAYDIVHAHYGHNGKQIAELKEAGFFKGAKLVTTFHGFDIIPSQVGLNKKRYRKLFACGDLFTVNSNFTGNLLTQAGCPPEKIEKIPVGLDTSFYKGKYPRKQSGVINIIFCGRFIVFKAPDLVVEITKYLVEKKGVENIKVYLVGDGEMKGLLEQMIVNYKLTKYIELLGSKTQREIIEIMSGMDIFLYPGIKEEGSGRAENQGLVIQEAQSLELPVVTSDVGGIAEGVLHEQTGFVLPARNIEQFAERIVLLMKDPELRSAMGRNGRKYVQEKFDSKVVGDQLEKKYFEILSKQSDH